MPTSWFQRLAPLMEWSYITRSQVPLYAAFAVWSSHYLWWLVAIFLLDTGPLTGSEEQLYAMSPTMGYIMLGTVPVFFIGEWLRRNQLEPEWYQHLTANYYGLWLVWGGYLTGSLNMASGVVLMGSPLIGFLFLHRRVVLVAILTSFLTLLGINILTANGALPYAPFMLPPQTEEAAVMWVTSHIMISAPHILFQIVLATVVIGHWRLRERAILQQSLTDALTGLHNRRSLLKQLVRELGRSRRKHECLSLLLFDLDYFKRINDTHGHPVGDAVLREAARLLQMEVRAGDTLARFGGEEFVLLLPHTDIEQAQAIAERCRRRLEGAQIPDGKGETIPVSASFGVSWIDAGGECNDTTLIADADAALYRAKENGRNRVELADGPSTFSQPYNEDDQHRHLPTHHKHINWKKLVARTSIRRILTNILSWTPVSNARMTNALLLWIVANVYAWLAYLHFSDDMAPLLNPDVVTLFFNVAPLLIGAPAFMILIGGYVNRRAPSSRLYVMTSVNLLAVTLVWIGYGIGILAMPTGILMVCTPIIGFLLFERWQILQPLLLAQVMVVAVAYLSATGSLEYAALFSREGSLWEPNSMFFVTTYYMASILMSVVALTLMNHILGRWRIRQNEVRELSITDTLTHTHNRHSILELLGNAREQTLRQHEPLSVIMLDLDHFKRINDTWGHPVGDLVLKESAKVLMGCLRDADVLGRFGGEEFLMVLPDTDQSGANTLAERCRSLLERLDIRADNGERIPVTASFGLCTLQAKQSPSPSNDDLLKLADDALYEAKRLGRNRVVAAPNGQKYKPALA